MPPITQKQKPLIIPSVILTFLAVAFLIFLIFFIGKIVDSRSQLMSLRSEHKLLEDRFATLENTKPDLSSSEANQVALALPPSNSSLLVISQIRRLALDNNVAVDNLGLSVNPPDALNMQSASITFTVQGQYPDIKIFQDKLTLSLPLVNLSDLKIDANTDSAEAKVKLTTYWSAYPKALPSLTQPIATLTSSEQELLSKISSYEKPQIDDVDSLTPSQKSDRQDPFSLQIDASLNLGL